MSEADLCVAFAARIHQQRGDSVDRGRWLLEVPELLRRVDPNAPGIMFLTALADIISKEESPVTAGFVRVKRLDNWLLATAETKKPFFS
jgi:hypothetical protein